MTLDLSRITFVNDVFSYDTEDGSLLFYALNEDLPRDSKHSPVQRVVIALIDLVGNETILSSIIGITLYGYTLLTEVKELEGEMLTLDNIALCSLETPNA